MTKVIIQKEFFSERQCIDNPKNLYIFGDNTTRTGKGGQAQIRDCKNSFGVCTKRLPTMKDEAFFSDSVRDNITLTKDINKLMDEYESGKWDNIVFPADGIGTGLSEMPIRCPKLFKQLSNSLWLIFGVKLTDSGFSWK